MTLRFAEGEVTVREWAFDDGTRLELRSRVGGSGRRRLVHLHGDEHTALGSAHALADALHLDVRRIATASRNITFHRGGRPWTFDPNRMFSDGGVRQSLKHLNGAGVVDHPAFDSAVRSIRAFSDAVVDALVPAGSILTAHNNTDENYGIGSYVDGSEAHVAADVHVNSHSRDPDDFFYVTTRELFEALAARDENVVLQRPDVADDGSLSWYAQARANRPYMNVEVQHGQAERNERMLRLGIEVFARVHGF